MKLLLTSSTGTLQNSHITITGSKSESNRLLILQQIFPNLFIKNLSDSDDSKHLQDALAKANGTIDIGHAGTAMRFLTAYFASKNTSEVILTGSERMQNRPIQLLVEALQKLGANISYQNKKGYPPIQIKGTTLTKNKVSINGNVSSQYISALLLIAPSLEQGLELNLEGEITSIPYIKMTLTLLEQLGVETSFKNTVITVKPQKNISNKTITVESDWSSVSYFYSLIALSKIGTEVTIGAYKKHSLQGDSCLAQIYQHFGVSTKFTGTKITITKEKHTSATTLNIDLKNAPDIAQTIAVTCFGLGVSCNLTGLHTLKIKETDRLEALQTELTKLGATIEVTENSLHLKSGKTIKENKTIETYNDHRMAMAFAPLALKASIQINDAMVVTKSYQRFWEDLKKVGVQIEEVK